MAPLWEHAMAWLSEPRLARKLGQQLLARTSVLRLVAHLGCEKELHWGSLWAQLKASPTESPSAVAWEPQTVWPWGKWWSQQKVTSTERASAVVWDHLKALPWD